MHLSLPRYLPAEDAVMPPPMSGCNVFLRMEGNTNVIITPVNIPLSISRSRAAYISRQCKAPARQPDGKIGRQTDIQTDK